MYRFLWLLLWLTACAAEAAALGYDDARHLLARTGFSPTDGQVRSLAGLDRDQAVTHLLAGARRTARLPLPDDIEVFTPLRRVRDLSEVERKVFQRELFQQSIALRAWWYEEMLTTDSPLTERMTLFWHNHFVSSQQKVKSPALMLRQNQLLRHHALGNFGELLHAVSRDPAMVVYLDNALNRKGQPNENFAREVMELFTLGEGHYGEHDIREAARAFTGWSIDRDTGEFRIYRFMQDRGEKLVLGRRGRFDGDDVLNILLAQPQTAELIVTKLWREFVSPTPEPREVARLAAIFRDSGYDIPAVLRALFTSDAFYAAENRATLVKSPVELLVGSLRQFDIVSGDPRALVLLGNQLGQNIFSPPNVKGWPGGEAWIDSNSLLARRQFLARLVRAEDMPEPDPLMAAAGPDAAQAMRRARIAVRLQNSLRFDAEAWLKRFSPDPIVRASAIERLVLAAVPLSPVARETAEHERLRALVLDPVYQLK